MEWTIRELVEPERFDAQNSEIYDVLFLEKRSCTKIPFVVGIIVCGIEWSFGVIFLPLYSLHMSLHFSSLKDELLQLLYALLHYYSVVLFMIAISEKHANLLKQQLIFQYVTCIFLLLNATFTFTPDIGGYNEEYLFG
ncbi:hypothetical protein LOAG_06293 [Loa loa]|uniref:Uncharacterized protein n=1 Tax=Loa loa TaxID=7209 RepID=A0A1S0TY79_LOALO|nr:hypothetical protein LOAG_06293 [Loa loa]EFO22195.1 hypothetical protein LOAG_06293 [Loa loa]